MIQFPLYFKEWKRCSTNKSLIGFPFVSQVHFGSRQNMLFTYHPYAEKNTFFFLIYLDCFITLDVKALPAFDSVMMIITTELGSAFQWGPNYQCFWKMTPHWIRLFKYQYFCQQQMRKYSHCLQRPQKINILPHNYKSPFKWQKSELTKKNPTTFFRITNGE